MVFFFCEYKELKKISKLQKGPYKEQNYSPSLAVTRPRRRPRRRRWRAAAPTLLFALEREQSPSAREVADRRPQRTYTSGRRRRRSNLHQPPAQKRRRQIRRPAASGEGETAHGSSAEL